MATLAELRPLLKADEDANLLYVKVISATAKAANNLLGPDVTQDEKKFVGRALLNTEEMAKLVLKRVVSDYSNLDIAQIENATDTQIQSAVDAVIEYLVGV